MESCISQSGCKVCSVKLSDNSPIKEIVSSKKMEKCLEEFLCTLNINDQVSESSSALYSEESLASVILKNLDEFKVSSDIVEYLDIFGLKKDTSGLVGEFIVSNLKVELVDNNNDKDDSYDDDSDKNTSDRDSDLKDDSEYFDPETD